MLAAYRELALIFMHPLTLVPLTMCPFDEMLVTTIELFKQKHDKSAKDSSKNKEQSEFKFQYIFRILPPKYA